MQRHNGTLGTIVIWEAPLLAKLSYWKKSHPSLPPSFLLYSPVHPFMLHVLPPHSCSTPILVQTAHIAPPYIINNPLPLYTFYTLYTSTQMLYTFVYTVCLSLSPLYSIHIYVAFTIFYQHCSHCTTLLLIIIAHSSSADRIVQL